MTDSNGEQGIILTLIERFEKQRLPRLLELAEQTGKGQPLSDADIEFLDAIIHDAQQSKPLFDRHPVYQEFCAQVIHLYETITKQALDNERGK